MKFKSNLKDKNLIDSIIELMENELVDTTKLSNQIILNLEKQIEFYKNNKDIVDKLTNNKIAEEARLKNIYIKQQSKIASLKALNNVGTVINLYNFKKSIDNIVNKIEYNKKLTKFDYMDVLSAIIAFNPIGAVGSQVYAIGKEIDKTMDITNGINDNYRNSIWAIRDQYFRQYHILANRGFNGKSKKNFIELFKKQRESLRSQIVNLLNEIEDTSILYGKDETIRILSNIYDVIAPDKEGDIIKKQEKIYDVSYQYYLKKQEAFKELKVLKSEKIFDKELHLDERMVGLDEQVYDKLKLFFEISPSVTISGNTIKANINDDITLVFSAGGGGLTEWVGKAVKSGKTVTLWYDDIATGKRKSVGLSLVSSENSDGLYKLSFKAPSKKFIPMRLTYYDDERNGDIAFDLGLMIEYVAEYSSSSSNNDNTDAEYQQCIANGGTEIGCKVGLHLVGSYFFTYGKKIIDTAIEKKYAYISWNNYRENGIDILDISNPQKPVLVNSVSTNEYVGKIVIQDEYLYFGNQNLKIFDISNPTEPISVGFLNFNHIYGITISGKYAYLASGGEGLKIVDISNPTDPVIVNALDTNGTTLDIAVSGHYAYVADGYQGLKIVDLTNLTNPIITSSVETNNAEQVIISGVYVYLIDRDRNYFGNIRLKVIDISNLKEPKIVSSLIIADNRNEISKMKLLDHQIYIGTKTGLKIINVSNPLKPKLKTEFATGDRVTSIASLGKYAYIGKYDAVLEIIDISNPANQSLIGDIGSGAWNSGIKIEKNYVYVTDRDKGFEIIDISSPLSPIIKSSFYLPNANGLTLKENYAYVVNFKSLNIIDISDVKNPKLVSSIDTSGSAVRVDISGNYAYVADHDKGLKIIDVSDPANPILVGTVDISYYVDWVKVLGNYAYIGGDATDLKVVDISDPANPTIVNELKYTGGIKSIAISGNYIYATDAYRTMRIIDIANPKKPKLLKIIKMEFSGDDITVFGNYVFVSGLGGLTVIDISNFQNLKILATTNKFGIYGSGGVAILNNYAYVGGFLSKSTVVDWKKAIENYQIIQNYYHPTTYIYLTGENFKDGTIAKKEFTKEWRFSEDISDLDIEVVSNSYANSISSSSFIKSGNKLSVTLTPDTSKTINKLVLKFTKNGNPVKVSGSDTFWSETKTNYAPRLADGQITQLVSTTNEPAFLEIATYDGDGDSVTLSIEDDAGGYVGFLQDNPNKIFASFSDGKATHTIKIGLSDGKEKKIVELNVLQFNQSSIDSFYSDVDKNAPDYPFDGIAFGTLKGVIWGQPDPNDNTKRIFRPKDNASMAEALAMIINAERRAGLIELQNSNYYMKVYPNWAMPYYTFAREHGAIEQKDDLASYYPTREEIAKIVVKTLGLDSRLEGMDINVTFSDSQEFSDASMLYYAKIAKAFGLFMTGESAKPKEKINRAELAMVIEKIFMIPQANLVLEPTSGEYGSSFTYRLDVTKAEAINGNFTLYDNSDNIQSSIFTNSRLLSSQTINNSYLAIGPNALYAVLDNEGVKNIAKAIYTVNFSDKDGDGIQDKDDVWSDDPRYGYDDNGNGIPDILDSIYNLSDYNSNSVVTINDQEVAVADLIENGGIISKLKSYNLYISKGWSLKALPVDEDINTDIFNNTEILWKWDNNESKWLAWSPNSNIAEILKKYEKSGEIGLFNKIKPAEGFWIYSKATDVKSFDGNSYGLEQLDLNHGWNLVGVGKDITVNDLQDRNIQYVWQYNSGKWRVWSKNLNEDIYGKYEKVENIKSTEGFWVFVK